MHLSQLTGESVKKLLMAPLILLGACAACCATPLLAPLLVGLFTSGVSAAFGQSAGLAALTIGVGLFFVQRVRRKIKLRSAHAADPCQATRQSPGIATPCGCNTDPQA